MDVATGWQSVVDLLRTKRKIVVLTGAGISVSCGIPDFRSKDHGGLYHTLDAQVRVGIIRRPIHEIGLTVYFFVAPLQGLGLSSPEELFDLHFFREDPVPFYKFAKQVRRLYCSCESKKRGVYLIISTHVVHSCTFPVVPILP
jgi:NAD-dependent SIR2 family protein deacetylase